MKIISSTLTSKIFIFPSLLAVLISVYLIMKQGVPGDIPFIFYLAVIIASVLLIGAVVYFKEKLHIAAVIVIAVLGLLTVFIMPILNSPDEPAHFVRAEMITDGHLLLFSTEESPTAIYSYVNFVPEVTKPFTQTDLAYTPIETEQTPIVVSASGYLFVGYLPQALGVFAAKALHLPQIWMLWLGRISNLLFYCIIIFFAVKLAPDFKLAIFFIAAMPMSIQQAASTSLDMIINAGGIFSISYFLYLYYEKSPPIKYRHVVFFLFIVLLTSLMKVTYAPLILLIFLIPRKRFAISYTVPIRIFLLLIVLLLNAVNVQRMLSFSTGAYDSWVVTSDISATGQIGFILSNPINAVGILLWNMFYDIPNYVHRLHTYGWIRYSIALIEMTFPYILAYLCFQKTKICFDIKQKILIALITLGIYGSTLLIMYLMWSPVGSTNIWGIQGRYFIPMILLIPLIFSSHSSRRIQPTGEFLLGTAAYREHTPAVGYRNIVILVATIISVCIYLIITINTFYVPVIEQSLIY